MGERRMMDPGAHDSAEYMPNPTRERLEEMTRSSELACGLHAVILSAFQTKNKVLTQTITDVSQGLRTVRFRAAKKLRSALFWKSNNKKSKKKKVEPEAEKDKEAAEKDNGENGDSDKKENGSTDKDKKDDGMKVDMKDTRS